MSICDLAAVSGLTHSAVTIGMFDGVHLGHRALIQALLAEAKRLQSQAVILTFDRHPAEILRPEKLPKFITTVDQRLAALGATGVDLIAVAAFDRAMSELSPREFFERILVETLKAEVVVVGPDFKFGKGRTGDFTKLSKLGVERGVATVAIPPVIAGGAPVSSTRIRSLLLHGAVADAAQLLGHPFVLEGTVVKGEGLGRKLGFPTANLQVDPRQIIPASGVYSADAAVLNRIYQGVVSIGSRPTVGGSGLTVEVFIADFDRDIYGERIRVGLRQRLRDQKKFATLEQLIEQMKRDVEGTSTDPSAQVH
jgi:riboflavin kinase / FMN adenylyltransferase